MIPDKSGAGKHPTPAAVPGRTLRLDCHAILGPGGAIAAARPDFEARPQQLAMTGAVADAIATRTHLVAEAGTGVGKSYAYLVPAILHAIESRGRGGDDPPKVVISTHTKVLQGQLLEKDIPSLQGILPPFLAVLVKGRNNYLSRRRLSIARQDAEDLFEKKDHRDELDAIARWSAETKEGSKDDLDFAPSKEVWEEVQSDRHDCLKTKCPSHGECFLYAARARMKAADALIVNHALYTTQLAAGGQDAGVFPRHDLVVFDEAHTLEGVATDHFGRSTSNYRVLHLLRRIWNDRRHVGLAGRASRYFPAQWFASVCARVDRAWAISNEFFGGVQEDLGALEKKWFRTPPAWPDQLVEECKQFATSLAEDAKALRPQEDSRKVDVEKAGAGAALASAAHALEEIARDIDVWLRQSDVNTVYWSERTARTIALKTAPLNVGDRLGPELFDVPDGPTCILTSATLAIGRPPRFDHARTRLGIGPCATLQLGSPFDYRRQVAIHLPRGLPDPGDPKRDGEFQRLAIQAIPHYLEKTKGRAFVLFTSNEMLKAAAHELRGWIAARGWTLLSQSDGLPRGKMIERFRGGGCVLFGVDSFWAGVDVPGEALSNVIIVRLPFPFTKGEPIHEARMEDIRRRGGRPFVDYQVPIAILKLKQGFGRLIRSRSDRGIVVILDPRVRTKGYGRMILDSLPDCRRLTEDLEPPRPGGPEGGGAR